MAEDGLTTDMAGKAGGPRGWRGWEILSLRIGVIRLIRSSLLFSLLVFLLFRGSPVLLRLFIVPRAPRRQGQSKFSLRSKP